MKKMKKVLAMLLSFVMIVGLVAVNGGISAKASNELDLSSFGFTSGYNSDTRKWASDSLMGKEFSAIVRFEAGGYFRYALNDWIGLDIKVINNNTIRYTDYFKESGAEGRVIDFTKEQAGLEYGFLSEAFKLTFKLETGETTDDFKLGIYFNDNLLNDEYLYGENEIASLGQGIYLYKVSVHDVTEFAATEMDRVLEVEPFTEGKTLKEVTLSDFGRQNGAYYSPVTAGHYGKLEGGILDTVLSLDVMFEPGGYIRYPMQGDGPGIDIKVSDNTLLIREVAFDADGRGEINDVLATLTPSAVGCALVGNDLNLKVAIERIDEDEDEIPEVYLSYYINDSLVFDTVVYDDGDNYIAIKQYEAANTMLLENVVAKNPGKVPVMQQYTPKTLGMSYQKATGDTYSTVAGAVDQVFTTDLKFHTTDADGNIVDSSAFSFAKGLNIFYRKNEGISLKLSDFKLEGCENGFVLPVQPDEQFNLKISLDKVDCDNDTFADDLKIGIFVNDKLCSNKFYYSIDGYMRILDDKSLVGVSNGVELIAPSQVPTGLREYSHLDFGLEDKTYTGTTSGNLQASGTLLNTLFTTNVTINSVSDKFNIQYGGGDVSWHVQYYASGTIRGWNGYENYFTIGAADLLEKYGVEKTFKLQISVEEADTDLNGDGKYNDVRVGYFANGHLIEDKFFANNVSADTVYNLCKTSLKSLRVYRNADFSINLTSDTITYDPDEYTEVSIRDFGLEDGTYTYSQASDIASGRLKEGLGSVNNKALFAKVTFDNSGSGFVYLAYAGNPSINSGANLRVGLNGASGLTRQFINTKDYGNGNGQNIYGINGITQKKEVNLMITTRFVNGDLQYGIWVDGVLFQNHFYTIRESVYKVTNQLGLSADAGSGTVKLGEENPLIYSCLDERNYEIPAPASGTTLTLDDVAVTEATIISLPGARVLKTVRSNFNGMKTIVSYRQNDVNQDNVVTILDLVSMKKNEAGEKDYDIVSRAAANLSEGEKCGTEELNTMRTALVK